MFWEILIELCNRKGISPNGLCAKLGYSSATATNWKKGAIPHKRTLKQIADYFNVSTGYLLGKQSDNNYGTHIIAYIDILGTKNMMKDDKNICSSFTGAYDILKKSIEALESKSLIENVTVRIFSDNFLIASKDENCADTIVLIVAFFQMNLLLNGLFARGGITKGDLFVGDDFVMGDGLVNAYKLENEISKYPRVIISDTVVNDIKQTKFIRKDSKDGEYFINYLKNIENNNYKREAAEKCRETIEECVINNDGDDDVLIKMKWMLDYYKKTYKEIFSERPVINEIVYEKAKSSKNICDSIENKYAYLDEISKANVDNVINFEYEQTLKRAELPKPVYYFPEYDIPVSAGTGIPLDYSNYELTELTVKPPRGANYIVTVSGDSMEPTFFNGDRLFIKKEASIEYGEIGLFYYHGDVYVKEYTSDGLLSHNKKYPIIDKNEDIQCIGRVLQKVSE